VRAGNIYFHSEGHERPGAFMRSLDCFIQSIRTGNFFFTNRPKTRTRRKKSA
jgi:hypothetical protein